MTMDGWTVERCVSRTAQAKKRHVHSTYEIYYLERGQVTYVIGDEIYNVLAGDVVLIPRSTIHNTVYGDTESERLLINFPKGAVPDPALLSCFDERIVSLDAQASALFSDLFDKMLREHSDADRYSPMMMTQLLGEMLVCFCRMGARKAPAQLDSYTELMRTAVKYINANSHADISLSEVAETVGLSRSFFSKKFKEITGFGFNEYLVLVRVMNAKQMLASGTMSVTGVAFACGFNDSSYFASVFRKHIGMTPHKYAKQRQGRA